MCGIAGIFHTDPDRTASTERVAGMVDRLSHRGPDSAAVRGYGPAALGHTRLSILDLTEGGAQPMKSAADAVISYNGECYNFRELARDLTARGHRFLSGSDTEVVLALYEERGPDFVRDLRGMFALAVWDGRAQRLLLCRDRLGIKPLYYHFDGRTLAFASELTPLLTLPWIGRDIDPVWLGTYFSMLSVPGPDSVVGGIRRLPPGCMLAANRDGIRVTRYWDVIDLPMGAPLDEETAAKELRRRLEETVAAHLVSDAPLGIALSGGIDSGLVAKLASLHADHRLNAYSATFPAHAEFDEAPLARENARNAGARLWETSLGIPTEADLRAIVRRMDEPLAISSAVGIYHLAKRAHEDVKVLLTGDGADELFAGYLFRHDKPLPEGIDPARGFAHTLRYFGENDLGRFLDRDFVRETQESWWRHAADCLRASGDAPTLGDRLRAELKTTLESEMLTKVDRMTMAWGVEARVPFLDHTLVEWVVGLPDALKLKNGTAKRVLKRCAADLLPEPVLTARKKGFNVPFHRWLADDGFRDFFAETVAGGRYAGDGLFSRRRITGYLADLDAGRDSLEQGHLAFALLVLELWRADYESIPAVKE